VATTSAAPHERAELLRKAGATVVVLPGKKEMVDLKALAKQLCDMGIQSVLVEGGSRLLSSLFAAALVDRVVAFFGPKIVGGVSGRYLLGDWGVRLMKQAVRLEHVAVRRFGTDVCVEGYVRPEDWLASVSFVDS